MTDRTLDELGPVDYVIVEFPPGAQNFTGEGADELIKLKQLKAAKTISDEEYSRLRARLVE